MATTTTDLLAITPIAANTMLGNNTGVTAIPKALTASQAATNMGLATIAMSGSGADLAAGTVANAALANVGANTVKGSVAGGVPADLTATQLTTISNAVVGDSGSGGTKGDVPAPPSGSAADNKVLGATGLFMTPVVIPPEGRLTTTSGTPVLTSSQTAQAALYYHAFTGAFIPLFNGTDWGHRRLAANSTNQQISINLDSASGHTGYHQLTKQFDVFAFNNSGVMTLGTGPAWTSATARGTGAGTTEIVQQDGVWVNNNTILLKIDATASQISVNQFCATYLGSFYATANGQTGMDITKVATSTGGNPILGLYNGYNRVRVVAQNLDSTASYTYATATIRAMNASANNRVSWIDGLQYSSAEALAFNNVTVAGAVTGSIGLCLDNTTSYTGGNAASGSTLINGLMASLKIQPQIGFHFVSAVESASGATVTFAPASFGGCSLSLEM